MDLVGLVEWILTPLTAVHGDLDYLGEDDGYKGVRYVKPFQRSVQRYSCHEQPKQVIELMWL